MADDDKSYIEPQRHEPNLPSVPPEIFEAELRAIREAFKGDDLGRSRDHRINESGLPSVDRNLYGLALSGGGIRSATFALGVMQALAEKGLLERFQYLSTVSGGGYIGSSLTWLLSNRAYTDNQSAETGPDYKLTSPFSVESGGFPYGTLDPKENPVGLDGGISGKMLGFLRRHGNYLTPGNGITLTSGIAIALRGILLNLIVWVPITTALMFLMLAVGDAGVQPINDVYGAIWPDRLEPAPGLFGWVFGLALLSAAAFLLLAVLYSLRTYTRRRKDGRNAFVRLLVKQTRYVARYNFECYIRWTLWIFAVGVVIGSVPLVHHGLGETISEAGGVGGFLLGALLAGRTYLRSSQSGSGSPSGAVAAIAALLMVYGVALLSYHLATLYVVKVDGWTETISFGVVPLAVAIGVGFFVNLNYVSLHRFYRDRLMETFMPAIDAALANKTGRSRGGDEFRLSETLKRPDGVKGPYHIVNTNVVLVDSLDRKLRLRGGDSFMLSPLYCGGNATGWQKTQSFAGNSMTLSTAMAISGAAANPNTGGGGKGLTRNRAVAMVMALLNVRLGYWVPHPSRGSQGSWWRPINHFSPGFRSWIGGFHREDRPILELSDGAHFENLGVYELIRRRCRLIVVCDGGADPEFKFDDLGTVLRRIEVDFGVRIDFGREDLGRLIPKPDQPGGGFPKGVEVAARGYAVGTIHYPELSVRRGPGDTAPSATIGGGTGTLIYLKTTLIPELDAKILAYAGRNPDFPDQTIADQFFV